MNPPSTEGTPTAAGGSSRARRVGVQFRTAGTIHEFDAGRLELAVGDRVVVEGDLGDVLGDVVLGLHGASNERGPRPRRVLRRAREDDQQREERSLARERAVESLCATRIRDAGHGMKLVRVEVALDGSRATVFFVAESRVDFRGLARDLADEIGTRIEMRQIGARDEAKNVGAMGPCGRELCCSSWLREFHAVGVKMAKAQDLSLNPAKLAGMCGRLKCCLRYEYETYLELKKGLPRLKARVTTVHGDGTVVRLVPLRQRVGVRLDDGGDVEVTLEDLVVKKRLAEGEERPKPAAPPARSVRTRGGPRTSAGRAGERPVEPGKIEQERVGEGPTGETMATSAPAESSPAASASPEGGKPDGAKPSPESPPGTRPKRGSRRRRDRKR